MNTLILSTKVFLISAGILSLAIAMKLAFPIAMNEIPVIWSVVMSWLKPPYLYLVINVIIITIAATSRFYQTDHSTPLQSEHSISVRPLDFSAPAQQPEFRNTVGESFPAQELYDDIVEVIAEEKIIPEIDFVTEKQIEAEFLIDEHEMVASEILQLESLIPVREKPLVASSFGKQKKKPLRSNPQVPVEKTLRLPRPTKHETLENTWKMITEGRLNKPETFEQNNDHVPKPETFNEPSLPIRKEASTGQEELNRRVEEFIKKINEDMRVQRQESLNQYMDMISRGV